MIWGRFATGTHVWHKLPNERNWRLTLCGRRFGSAPQSFSNTEPNRDDLCARCAGVTRWNKAGKPKAMAAGGVV